MKFAQYSAAAMALVAMTATPAVAQVDVRVKVDTKVMKDAAQDVAREVRAALHSALGPEFRRNMEEMARDLASAFEGLGEIDWDFGDWTQSQRYRATQTDRETRRFTVGPNGQLDLETVSGDITIRRGSGREIVVEIVREARGLTDADAKTALTQVKAVSEDRGGRVTVKAVYPNMRRGSDYSVSVSYIVSAPVGTRLSTRSLSGDVTVDGIDGELSINTTSGDVKVTDCTRLVSAKTVSGDMTLTNTGSDGRLEASTMSGEITAAGLKARRLDLGTVSGGITARNITADDVKLASMSDDVWFEGTLTPRGRYEFTSHAGDVHIVLDGKVGFSFEASTFSGSVRSDLALQGSRTATRALGGRRAAEPRNLSGTFGDGSAVITANSFSGSVVVSKK